MAEVIIPPEELEPELPEEQLPQVEKPTEKSKVISVNFNPLNTKQTASLDTHESFFTTDSDAWIVLNVGDMNEPTGQYSLALINKEDGSIFQRTGDIVQGVAYYKLLPNEIKHAGRWVGQAVITLANGQTTASRFSFNVSGHILDGKDVREIVIQDFQTLMAQLNDLKDNSTNEFGLLKNEIEAFQTTIQENEDERQATELERVAAEIIREENYESKVTAAIVEADVVEKVDNKVAELAPTIQNVTAQLAQTERKKADVTYVDQSVSRMSGGAIKGTYTTLVALKTTYPIGAVGPFMIEETGNRYIWDVNKLDWVNIGPYEPAEVAINSITGDELYGITTTILKDNFGDFENGVITSWAGYSKVLNADGSFTQSYTNTGSSLNYMYISHKIDTPAEENHTYLLAADVTLNSITGITSEEVEFYSLVLTNTVSNTSGVLGISTSQKKINASFKIGKRNSIVSSIFVDGGKSSTVPHYIFSTPYPIPSGASISVTYHNFLIYDLGLKGSENEISSEDAYDIFLKHGYGDAIEKEIPITVSAAESLKGFDLNEYNEKKDSSDAGISDENIFIGDSLTIGSGGGDRSPDGTVTTYPNVFAKLSGVESINTAVGGDKVWDIFARLGSDAITVNGFTIPSAVTPVTLGTSLKTISGNTFASGIVESGVGDFAFKINPVTISGITGKLLKSRTTGEYYFTRSLAGTAKVINRPTIIVTDLMKNYIKPKAFYVFWVGQNGGYADTTDWINQISRAIKFIGCTDYLVIGSKSEIAYSSFKSAYDSFRTVFGSKFIDLHRYLLDYGMEDAGLTPTADDLASISNGIIPSSLKKSGDPIHLNHYGYTVVGNVVYTRAKEIYPVRFS